MRATANSRRIPELDGLRVLMIFIVSWYHIWQQSWLGPEIRIDALHIYYSLDYLVRSGYVWVDGTVLLSAFLLYLPIARDAEKPLPDPKSFLLRKAARLLPSFWFIVLVFFFGMCLPWGLYNGNGPFMVKDLFTHLTLIFPYFRDTYIWTPMGAAPWTLSLVAQGYLLFLLIAGALRKKPYLTLGLLAGFSLAFRAWCLWALTDYSMVVNTFANFLDVYAIGFGSAMLFARIEKTLAAREVKVMEQNKVTELEKITEQNKVTEPEKITEQIKETELEKITEQNKESELEKIAEQNKVTEQEKKTKQKRKIRGMLLRILATVIFFGSFAGVLSLLRLQAASGGDQSSLQGHQMMYRTFFALGFAGLVLSAPFCVKPLRFLLGNRVTRFLAGISLNYYLIHQTLAVHLKRLGFPPSVSDTPNMAGERTWQIQYTVACFALSFAAAVLVTYLIEKPVGKWLSRRRNTAETARTKA